MNVELLRKIAQVIQEKPAEFDMHTWHEFEDEDGTRTDCNSASAIPRGACGTTHCIAGWAQIISPSAKLDGFASVEARIALDITEEQAAKLFHTCEWPTEFVTMPDEEDSYDEYATTVQAAARIEHFIATEGRE